MIAVVGPFDVAQGAHAHHLVSILVVGGQRRDKMLGGSISMSDFAVEVVVSVEDVILRVGCLDKHGVDGGERSRLDGVVLGLFNFKQAVEVAEV